MPSSDQMEFYASTTLAWKAMCEACSLARISIDFEEYILRDDRIGSQLLNILVAKAREGLRVRVLLDAFGSRRIRHHPMMAVLRTAGVRLIFFRPLGVVSLLAGACLPRDHAKTLHIDGRQSFIGSMCVADHMLGWRDTLVAFDGNLAVRARDDFERIWCQAAGLPLPTQTALDSDKDQRVVETYVCQDPPIGVLAISDALLSRIKKAERSICLASPYFFPTRTFRDALRAACQRGVLVTLILTSQTDMAFADTVTRGLVKTWRQMGFQIHFYQPAVLHAKYAIVDETWATVGSCNFDILSLRLNREANLIIQDPAHVATLVRQSERDRHNSLPTPAFERVPTGWNKAIGHLGAHLYRCL